MQRFGSAYSSAISILRGGWNSSIAAEQCHNFGKRWLNNPSLASRAKKLKTFSWTHNFFCLSEVNDKKVPTSTIAKNMLILAGLGEKRVTISNTDCGAKEFYEDLFSEFPKLRQGGGVEFLKCTQSTRKLETIPFEISSSPRLLRSYIGAARVYVRLIQASLDLTPAKEVVDQVRKWLLRMVKVWSD